MSGAVLMIDPRTVKAGLELLHDRRLSWPPEPMAFDHWEVPPGEEARLWRRSADWAPGLTARMARAFAGAVASIFPPSLAEQERRRAEERREQERKEETRRQRKAEWDAEVARLMNQELLRRQARRRADEVEEAAAARPEGEPSSWAAVDVAAVLAGGAPEIVPTVLARTDGACLFYPARVHWVSGEPDVGKGWLICHAAAGEIRAGRHVVYVDYEDNAEGVLSRLVDLGLAPPEVVARFHYVRPTESLRPADWEALAALATTTGATLAVLDGVTEAMGLEAWDPMANTDVARWLALLPRPLADLGPAVVVVDHVVKNPEARGNYAIGGQHKQAGLTGAAYRLDRLAPFAKGADGAARIIVKKDRPGEVRRLAGRRDRELVAVFRMTSDVTGRVTRIGLSPPEGAGSDVWRPTNLMEKVSKLLEAAGAPLPKGRIEDGVVGTAANIRVATDRLVAEGYVRRWPEGAAHLHESVRPYREADDTLDEYGRPRADLRMDDEGDQSGDGEAAG